MPAALWLPEKDKITCVDPNQEPTRYYYWPVVGWFYRKRLQMVLDLLEERHFESILEVAYGSGIFLPSLAARCNRLFGIDLHERIDLVKDTLAKARVEADLTTGNALQMPYDDGSLDCVVNVSMLEHFEEPGPAIDEMLRVLKPGGVLALGFPSRNPWMDAFFRVIGFDPREVHPSSHTDILKALGKRSPRYVLRTLPAVLPLDFSLYCACGVLKAG